MKPEKVLTRVANKAGADVNVVETVDTLRRTVLQMHCTGCDARGVEMTRREFVMNDAQKHAEKCRFQPPR